MVDLIAFIVLSIIGFIIGWVGMGLWQKRQARLKNEREVRYSFEKFQPSFRPVDKTPTIEETYKTKVAANKDDRKVYTTSYANVAKSKNVSSTATTPSDDNFLTGLATGMIVNNLFSEPSGGITVNTRDDTSSVSYSDSSISSSSYDSSPSYSDSSFDSGSSD